MDAVVGFHIHRGVLAAGRRAEPTAEALLADLPAQALVVGLCGIANHDNMGGLFRNAAAFGADAVLIDDDCCDPLYRKAIRVSVGAALTTPFARAGSAAELADRLVAAGFEVLALSPRGDVTPGAGASADARTAVRRFEGEPGGRGIGADPHRPHRDGRRFRLPERGHVERHRPEPAGGIIPANGWDLEPFLNRPGRNSSLVGDGESPCRKTYGGRRSSEDTDEASSIPDRCSTGPAGSRKAFSRGLKPP